MRITLKNVLIALAAVTLLLLVAARAQDKPAAAPANYVLTEVQTLRLQLHQRDAQLAQRDLQAAQARFQQTLSELSAEADRIKLENKWPKDTQFEPNTLSFSAPPPPPAPAKKPEPKKPESKK